MSRVRTSCHPPTPGSNLHVLAWCHICHPKFNGVAGALRDGLHAVLRSGKVTPFDAAIIDTYQNERCKPQATRRNDPHQVNDASRGFRQCRTLAAYTTCSFTSLWLILAIRIAKLFNLSWITAFSPSPTNYSFFHSYSISATMPRSVFALLAIAQLSKATFADGGVGCNADNCARAVTGSNLGAIKPWHPIPVTSRQADCSSFQISTITPAALCVYPSCRRALQPLSSAPIAFA
jgi:hypothetical protein